MFLKKNIFCQNWLHNSGSGSILGQNSGSGPKFDVFGSTTMEFTSLTNSLRYDDDLRPLSRLAVMSVVLQTSSGWRWRTLWWAAWAGAAVGAGEPPGSPTTATASMAPATATGIPTGMLLVICNFFFLYSCKNNTVSLYIDCSDSKSYPVFQIRIGTKSGSDK